MGSRSASSFSVDVFVQTPLRSNVLHNVSTQLLLTEFFIGCIYSNDPLDSKNFVRQSPPSVQGPHALLQPPQEKPASPPDLATHSQLLATHGASSISFLSQGKQSPVSTTHVGDTPCTLSNKRRKEVPVPPFREPSILLVLILAQEQVLFLKPRALVLPMVKFGPPK